MLELDLGVLARPVVLAPAILLVGFILYQLFASPKLKLPDLPVVGAKPGEWFSIQRTKWRNALSMEQATMEAYTRYKDQACIFPLPDAENLVMLPFKEMKWLLDQPDSELSMHEQIQANLQLEYSIMDPRLTKPSVHVNLVTTQLTRETGNLMPALLDEIQYNVDRLWGTDTENFKTIGVYDIMRRVIGHATNRVFVGLPLCRDPKLLDAGMAVAQNIPLSSVVLRLVWAPLRPLAALFATLPTRIYTNQFNKILRPEIERRLKEYEARQADPETKAGEDEPNDFLQWSIRQAKTLDDPYYSKVDTLAGRVMLLNFASIHTSSFAITHVILDLACSRREYVEELREEIRTVLAEHGGTWNKRAVAAMTKLDSVMRESQRINSFVTTATNRIVVNPKGVTTPSGVRLPCGTTVAAPGYPVFRDPAIYPDPEEFKPFRFAEKRAVTGADHSKDKSNEKSTYIERARQAFATTSPEFAAFGHGRHACPGRFFASSELKLMLAYIVLNYDFEFQEKRPENFWFGQNRVPPLKAEIRIKRVSA